MKALGTTSQDGGSGWALPRILRAILLSSTFRYGTAAGASLPRVHLHPVVRRQCQGLTRRRDAASRRGGDFAVLARQRVYSLLVYAKAERVDLSPADKRALRAMTHRLEEVG